MSLDDIVNTGLLALFGGTLVWVAIGALVGRFQGFNVGLATGMILFGLTGLGFAGWLAWLLWGPGADGAPGPDQIGIVGAFGAFGGFGALGGTVVLTHELERRHPRATKPVSARRAGLATVLVALGNLVLIGGAVMGMVIDDDLMRGSITTFSSVTLACCVWFAASVVGRRLKLYQVLILVLVGGGFYLAAESMRLFGPLVGLGR